MTEQKTKAAAEPPLDCRVRATMSLCCGIVRGGWNEPDVMHTGACRDKHGGELGPTYYLGDSGLVMDPCGIMRPRSTHKVTRRACGRSLLTTVLGVNL